ncbi:hypothetical protein K443DRAFT_675194 [Laccaria amethystina LaAM-08-1]|uniref:Unplaced genomic scaffold K443scaffold_25, whole genome shotgun sequence n=1 Tax=Laccaria amethystina LaAM-08-1 TaxID=1095629 RepID=A0A0C9X013_9AGAR|nr:hypothetical protein K443DRAFT_675194 [Laccaria amethystina LaAM-08-1]
MHPLSFTLSVLLAFVAVHAAPSQPSGAPTCTYSCPQVDEAGFGLGNNSNDGTTVFCSYPAFAGEPPNDFFCTYSNTDGHLTQDHDAGFCPATAVQSCGSRRRGALKRAPAPPMVAPVARALTPEMKVRAQLKKRQPVRVEA